MKTRLFGSLVSIFVGVFAFTGPAYSQAPLVDITSAVGLDFVHESTPTDNYHLPEIMGGGGALFDYDQDGDLDIYAISAGSSLTAPTLNQNHPNRLFQQQADGSFEDVTQSSGLGHTGYGMGATLGDVDNDGDLDVFVTNYGEDALFRNEGDGRFTEITRSAGVSGAKDGWSTAAIFFDYDGDGYLDLFVLTYISYDPTISCRDLTGRKDYCSPASYRGAQDVLFKNNGNGTFTDVTRKAGLDGVINKGLGVVSADFDLDGRQDIYVANDGEKNSLWINLGNGRFEDQATRLGSALNLFGVPEASMGVAVGDVNKDSRLDLFMTHMGQETNTLYTSVSTSGFQDTTNVSGLGPDSVGLTGFGTAFFDADHDGDLDLAVVNGKVLREPDPVTKKLTPSQSSNPHQRFNEDYAEPNLLHANDGNGKFSSFCNAAASFCARKYVGRGLVLGDVDRDGDLDVLVTNTNGPAQLFRNDFAKQGSWLKVRAIDPATNRDAVGAVVHAETRRGAQTGLVTHSYSYLVSGEAEVHFGLGNEETVDGLKVRWPDGSEEQFPAAPANQTLRLVKGRGQR